MDMDRVGSVVVGKGTGQQFGEHASESVIILDGFDVLKAQEMRLKAAQMCQ